MTLPTHNGSYNDAFRERWIYSVDGVFYGPNPPWVCRFMWTTDYRPSGKLYRL